jgi:ubiquinone/menaquinone biosynthesis C-methylase UbiE
VRGDAALDFPDRRFTGAASFTMLHHVPSAELQDRRFAEVRRVLKPGAAFVAGDSLASDELRTHHESDTYNPIDPTTIAKRLRAVGFASIEVKWNALGWAAAGRA